jgi:hypothetical protein
MKNDDPVRILLTDDEALAIAVHRGKSWPSALPTLLTEDPELLLSAVKRGVRSLAVRNLYGLNGRDEFCDSLMTMCQPLLAQEGPILATFVADREFRYLTGFVTIAFYAAPDEQWLSEVTSPLGTHSLRLRDVESCKAAVDTLLDSEVHSLSGSKTESPTEQGSYFCAIGRPRSNPVRIVTACPEGLRATILSLREGSSHTDSTSTLSSAEAALRFLLDC